MSSRPLIKPFQVITNASMAGNITSIVTIVDNMSMISYDISWTGSSPMGAITVEVSDTYSQNAAGGVKNAGTWTELPLSAAGTVSGNTGTGFISLSQIPAYAVRIVYTRSSGTGTLNAFVNAKVA